MSHCPGPSSAREPINTAVSVSASARACTDNGQQDEKANTGNLAGDTACVLCVCVGTVQAQGPHPRSTQWTSEASSHLLSYPFMERETGQKHEGLGLVCVCVSWVGGWGGPETILSCVSPDPLVLGVACACVCECLCMCVCWEC